RNVRVLLKDGKVDCLIGLKNSRQDFEIQWEYHIEEVLALEKDKFDKLNKEFGVCKTLLEIGRAAWYHAVGWNSCRVARLVSWCEYRPSDDQLRVLLEAREVDCLIGLKDYRPDLEMQWGNHIDEVLALEKDKFDKLNKAFGVCKTML